MLLEKGLCPKWYLALKEAQMRQRHVWECLLLFMTIPHFPHHLYIMLVTFSPGNYTFLPAAEECPVEGTGLSAMS